MYYDIMEALRMYGAGSLAESAPYIAGAGRLQLPPAIDNSDPGHLST